MLENVIGILLIIMGIFLVISVLMQSSKNHRLSGSVAGGAETFFGKQKGKQMDAIFNTATTVVTIIFVVLVIVLYMLQPSPKTDEQIYQEMLDAGYLTVEGEETETEGTEAEGTETEGAEVEGTETTETTEDNTAETENAETPVENAETAEPEAETEETAE